MKSGCFNSEALYVSQVSVGMLKSLSEVLKGVFVAFLVLSFQKF